MESLGWLWSGCIDLKFRVGERVRMGEKRNGEEDARRKRRGIESVKEAFFSHLQEKRRGHRVPQLRVQ